MTACDTRRGALGGALAIPAGLVMLLACACATYTAQSRWLRAQLDAGNYDSALQGLEALDTGSTRLLYQYERGLILHSQGRFADSNQALDQAEQLLEDLYTRSVSREVTSLLTSDNVVEYRGDRFEAGMLHYYKIMNYLHLGQEEEAAVECRRLNRRLQQFKDRDGSFYRNDPFLQYLTGLVYAQVGAYVDADVSLRVALQAYRDLRQPYGVEFPAALRCDLARNALQLGTAMPAETAAAIPGCPPVPEAGLGTLDLCLEIGYVPARVPIEILLPIFKNEITDDLDHTAYAHTLAGRYGQPYDTHLELEYVLRVAVPRLQDTPSPVVAAQIRPQVKGDSHLPAAYTDVAENLATLAVLSFQEHQADILVRAVIRSLAKYLATRAAKEKSEAAGWIANIAGVATESADTRSWTTLPEKILMGRLALPPGVYALDIDLFDRTRRRVGTVRVPEVEVVSGRSTLLNHRVY